jgi:HNH endonuclease
MEDEFRAIEGYPGYQVTRFGEVLSRWSRRGRLCFLGDEWHPLKPIRRRWGHLSVNLCRAGKKTSRPVHRLVLESFVGPCPPGLICCHNDGDPSNNCVENLRWDSHQSNADDALRHGTRAMGSRCNAKLTEAEILEIRRLRSEGIAMVELASRYGVTPENVVAIVRGRSWRHLLGENGGDGVSGSENIDGRGLRQGAKG